MTTPDENLVSFTTKELLTRIDTRLDTIGNSLEQKADRQKLHDLTTVVATKATVIEHEMLRDRVRILELEAAKREGHDAAILALQNEVDLLKRFRHAFPSTAILLGVVNLVLLLVHPIGG